MMQKDKETMTLEKPLGSVLTASHFSPPALRENPSGSLRESASPPSTLPKPTTSSGHSKADKAQLSLCLSQVCILQRQYGKTEAELETLVEGFCWALDAYEMSQILDAIKRYVLERPEIPTPSEIVSRILVTKEQEDLIKAQNLSRIWFQLEDAEKACDKRRMRFLGELFTPENREWLKNWEKTHKAIRRVL